MGANPSCPVDHAATQEQTAGAVGRSGWQEQKKLFSNLKTTARKVNALILLQMTQFSARRIATAGNRGTNENR